MMKANAKTTATTFFASLAFGARLYPLWLIASGLISMAADPLNPAPGDTDGFASGIFLGVMGAIVAGILIVIFLDAIISIGTFVLLKAVKKLSGADAAMWTFIGMIASAALLYGHLLLSDYLEQWLNWGILSVLFFVCWLAPYFAIAFGVKKSTPEFVDAS